MKDFLAGLVAIWSVLAVVFVVLAGAILLAHWLFTLFTVGQMINFAFWAYLVIAILLTILLLIYWVFAPNVQ